MFYFHHALLLIVLVFVGTPVWGQHVPDTLQANQYYQQADSLSEQGNYERANQMFRQAQRIYQKAGHWQKYIACLNSIANNQWPVTAYDSASSLAQRALHLSEQYLGIDHPEAAQAYDIMGIVQEYQGHLQKALEHYEQSLKIKKKHFPKNHPQVADSYENLGIAYMRMYSYDKALSYHQRVLTIRLATEPDDLSSLGNAYTNIGFVYTSQEAYEQALSYYQKALTIQTKQFGQNHPQIAVIYNNIGFVYASQEAYEQALSYYQKALTIQTKQFGQNHPEVATCYNNLGGFYASQEANEQALNYLQKALRIRVKLFGQTHPEVAISYNNIGAMYASQGVYDQGLNYFQKALRINRKLFGSSHPDVTAGYTSIGNIYKKRDEFSTALLYYQKSLRANGVTFRDTSEYANPVLKTYLDGIGFLYTFKNKAETLASLKMDSLSYATYLAADSLLGQLRHSYQRRDDKSALNSTGTSLYEGGLQVGWQRYQATHDLQYYHDLFYLSERSKSNLLVEAMATLEAQHFGQVPDSLLSQENNLKSERAFYQSQFSQTPDSSLIRDQLFNVNQRYDSLMRKLEEQYPNFYQLKYATRTATIPTIQSQLSEDEAVISYFIGDSTRFAFAITHNQYHVTPLPTDTLLDQNVRWLHRGLHPDSTSYSKYLQVASTLHEQLLTPIINDSLLTGIKRLTIIPDGSLGYLPFDLLLTKPVSAGTGYRQLPYLMRDFTIRYGYSATWLFHPFSQPKYPHQNQYIAFAPSYQSHPDSTQQLALGRFRDQVAPLRFNQREATNIRQYLSGVSLTGSAALERTFKKEAKQYQILHLATHALVDDENPMYSRLVFSSDEADTLEDGYLNAYELYEMELPAELAVLSACETGYGKLQQGEGIMSLARAFAYAGCPSIVMSHWTVDDAASAQLMDYFYRYLSDGMPKDEALRQAKLTYLKTALIQDTHPFFWSNFVLIGNPSPIVRAGIDWKWYLYIGLGLVLTVLAAVLWRQRST